MNQCERLVIRLPLDSLWNETGELTANRGRALNKADLQTLLRLGPLTFVIADVAHPLRWVRGAECFAFWKSDVSLHLYDQARPCLDDYPSGYYYFAHEWQLQDGQAVVVLEKQH